MRRTLWLAMCLLISQTKRLTMQARPATRPPGYALQWALIQDVFNGDERSEVIAEVAEAFGEAFVNGDVSGWAIA